jgi:hypothetical protein
MFGRWSVFSWRGGVVVALFLASALTSASTVNASSGKTARRHRVARLAKPVQCIKAPVEIVDGSESSAFPLTRCDGAAIPAAVDALNVLTRRSAASASAATAENGGAGAAATDGSVAAGAATRIDARIVERLARVVDHFRRNGVRPRIVIGAATQSSRAGTVATSARALDFRMEGVKAGVLVTYCSTLPDTSCARVAHGRVVRMQIQGAGEVQPQSEQGTDRGVSEPARTTPGDYI